MAKIIIILTELLLLVSCCQRTDYNRLQEAIISSRAVIERDSSHGYFTEAKLLTDATYMSEYQKDSFKEPAIKCQEVIEVPQNMEKLPKPLQFILLSAHYQGYIFRFFSDESWKNQYQNSELYACMDDNGSIRVIFIKTLQ